MTTETTTAYNENRRQIEHIVPLSFAVLLRWLTPTQAAILAMVAMVYGVVISPRLVKGTVRSSETKYGFAYGKLIYALMVFCLILLFEDALYIAAGGWAMLSAGDGFATLIGRNFGERKLPWNKDKSWLGSMAFVVAGTVTGTFLMLWVSGRYPSPLRFGTAFEAALAAAFASAVVESIPLKWVDDNISVPLTGAVVIWLMVG